MKTLFRFFFLFSLILLCSSLVYSQEKSLENEILVYIQPGYFELPDDLTKHFKYSEIQKISNAIDIVVKNNEVESFTKAFPEFRTSDTLAYNSEGNPIKMADMSRIFIFSLKDIENKNTLIEELKKTEGVLFAEEHADWKTFDSRYPEQWWLNNTGQYGGTVDADIDAPEAWQITQGSVNVKVGIIDTGVEITHDDLSGKSSGDLPESYYSYGHGTHVAGIVGAKTGGGQVIGVSPNTSIVSRKVFSGVDSYGNAYWAGDNNAYNKIMNAIVNENCVVLNHSYGGPAYSTTLRMAFANVYKYNRTNTVSMGNNNSSNPMYPAAYGQGIIAVGATDNMDLRSQDNTPGYVWGSNFGSHIDVTAPGGKYAFINDKNILSTWTGNGYLKISGTSMAAPVVAGIASLLKAYNPNLYNDDLEQIIRISADDVNASTYPGWDQYLGTGRVNAYKALQLLQAPYQLSQLSASGGTDYSSTNHYQQVFYGTTGLADGVYIVKRHEVRKNVSFPMHFDHNVWGRGVGTNGLSAANPNFGMGYCDVVGGSVSSNSATLRTYVYEVWSISGQWIGWRPTTPQNVSFNYTVLGKPLVAPVISHFTQNPNPICKEGTGYVQVHLSQGNGNLTYNWFSYNQPSYVTVTPSGNICYITYHNTIAADGIEAPTWDFGCNVSNGAGQSTAYYTPALDPNCYGCPTLSFDNNGYLADENPLLITSLNNPGMDITDYYLINTPVTTTNNKIDFVIHEPQTEHTWLDQVQLWEVNTRESERVTVNDFGEVVNYIPSAPLKVILNNETDLTEILAELDSQQVTLNPGDVLTIIRSTEVTEEDGEIVLGGEVPPPGQKRIPSMILSASVPTRGEEGVAEGAVTEKFPLGEIYLRPKKSVLSKKLGNIPLGTIEVTINKELILDYLAIVNNLRSAGVTNLNMLSAVHSINGDVKSKLKSVDQGYAEIYPGEKINFSFRPTVGSTNRSYILKAVGRYETPEENLNKPASAEDIIVPMETVLYDNYPNPFNPSTMISYSLRDEGRVSIKVYDILGSEVATLVNETKPAGTYEVEFNANTLPSGVYIYRMQTGSYITSKKMLLVK